MAHQPLVGELVVGGNLEALHPALDRPGCRVRLRALEQTTLHINDVMAPGAEEADAQSAAPIGHRKLSLVAVALRRFGAVDHVHAEVEAADAAQSVLHPLTLELQLLGIAHVPQRTAAALWKVRAVRLDPGGGGGDHLLHPAPGGGLAHLQQLYPAALSPERTLDKDGHAVQPSNAVALAGVVVDREVKCLVFLGFCHAQFLRFAGCSPCALLHRPAGNEFPRVHGFADGKTLVTRNARGAEVPIRCAYLPLPF